MHPDLHSLIQGEVDRYQARVAQGYKPAEWILPEPSCELLGKLAERLGPRSTAFEFGSGLSTMTLRSTCAAVTSIEDSAEWLEKTEKLPGMPPKRAEDKTRVVPMNRCHLGLLPFLSFNLESRVDVLRRLESADLILIDSPPNPATREHALFVALQHAKPGALILIDDMEIRAALRFSQRLAHHNPELVEFVSIPIDHGLGLFQKTSMGDFVYRPSLREIVGTWLRR
jgi:hypothetical protein